MTDFVPQPRDRLEAPICNAIETKDFKQALKLVEKRLLKSSDSYFKALKCYIQCCHPLIVERGKAMGAILELLKLTGEKYTEGELELWDESVKALFPSRHGPEAKAVCRLRVDAVKASPKDERLALACFRACLKRDDIESAQNIAITLEKNFPNNHVYQFWRITTTFQISVSNGSSDIDVRTCTGLAYMLIKKYAAATSATEGVLPLPVKSIQTPQELLLLHRILSTQGKLNESLEVFKDPYLGPDSKVSKGEWAFHIKHLQHLEFCGEWKELLAKAFRLLSASHTGDGDENVSCTRGSDWIVWKAVIRAVLELQDPSALEAISEEIQEHLIPKTQTPLKNLEATRKVDYARKMNRRNASLALLELVFADPPLIKPQEGVGLLHVGLKSHIEPSKPNHQVKSSHVTLLSVYLDEYRHTASSFSDVRKFVEKLKYDEMKELMLTADVLLDLFREDEDTRSFTKMFFEDRHDLGDAEKITAGITDLKLEYVMKIGDRTQRRIIADKEVCAWCLEPFNSKDESCNYCLRHLVIQALHAYGSAIDDDENVGQKLLPTDRHPADDWAILAAMCLLKLAGCRVWTMGQDQSLFQKRDVQYVLQAAAILEYSYSRSKANPQISLLLVRLYSYLGAGSLALRAYHKLGIKQIQGDTLSYILFDRISSLHPHPVTDESSETPEELDPTSYLKKLQHLYRGFRVQISTNCWRSFENGSYDSIFQLMEVSDALSRSIASATSVIESRKIDRLINPKFVMSKNTHGFDILSPMMSEGKFSDNCDYSCFPNFERSENPPFENYIRLGPGPSPFRTKAFLIVEELWNFCSPPTEVARGSAFLRLKHVRDNALYCDIRDPNSLKGYVTEPEALLIAVSAHLMEIVFEHCDPANGPSKKRDSTTAKFDSIKGHILDAKELLRIAEASLGKASVEDWIPSFGSTLHPTYTAYEIGALVLTVSDILLKPGSSVRPEMVLNVMSMKGSANELHDKVMGVTKKVRGFVNEKAWLDWILDRLRFENIHNGAGKRARAKSAEYSISHSIMRVVGPQFCEYWAGEVMDSWRESVMGLACLEKGRNSTR